MVPATPVVSLRTTWSPWAAAFTPAPEALMVSSTSVRLTVSLRSTFVVVPVWSVIRMVPRRTPCWPLRKSSWVALSSCPWPISTVIVPAPTGVLSVSAIPTPIIWWVCTSWRTVSW